MLNDLVRKRPIGLDFFFTKSYIKQLATLSYFLNFGKTCNSQCGVRLAHCIENRRILKLPEIVSLNDFLKEFPNEVNLCGEIILT